MQSVHFTFSLSALRQPRISSVTRYCRDSEKKSTCRCGCGQTPAAHSFPLVAPPGVTTFQTSPNALRLYSLQWLSYWVLHAVLVAFEGVLGDFVEWCAHMENASFLLVVLPEE